ncbi:hypothetical protein E2C01_096730 [Portunus trituberculatus]|uniref:Uncharacterized protein n=1 Tax=Portunus trituberculatus TaxID=210409 RepID=A0A5B7JTA0_PORTR|nr:hypothetical protein [Portunus trituberculatus]
MHVAGWHGVTQTYARTDRQREVKTIFPLSPVRLGCVKGRAEGQEEVRGGLEGVGAGRAHQARLPDNEYTAHSKCI